MTTICPVPPTTRGLSEQAQSRTDWELVRAAQCGDVDAFGELYERHHPGVFAYVLVLVHDRPLAEDLASETFCRALRAIRSVSERHSDPGTWLFAIARNLVLDHWKRARSRREMSDTPTVEGAGETHTDLRPNPEQRALQSEDHTLLAALLARLNPAHSTCLVLRYGLGLSIKEIAARLDRTPGATTTLIGRALGRARELNVRAAA